MLTPAVLSAAIEDALERYGVGVTCLPITAEGHRPNGRYCEGKAAVTS